MNKRINTLTIGGTDPSGGAGIQADLKTFSSLSAYGTSVITALVAQNTYGIQSIYPIKSEFVALQLDSVLNDIRIDSAKIGMLLEESIVEVVADKLMQAKLPFIVLDTVMNAKSGDSLVSSKAIDRICELLFPQVSLITPNLLEAAILVKDTVAQNEKMILKQGDALINLGCQAVLMKGGHLNSDESPDWLITPNGYQRFTKPRVPTKNTHGTGCSLSAALTALRPRNTNWFSTMEKAKIWLNQALLYADTLEVGTGIGPVHHFHEWW